MRRRSFLKAAGVAGAGILAAGFGAYAAMPVIPGRPAPDLDTARGWITHAQGRYTLWLPRIEMGQNIATALKQIACEELGVDWSDVALRQQDTGEMAPVRATVGSESVMEFGPPLARACAALREAIAAGLPTEGEIPVPDRPLPDLRAFQGKGRFVGRKAPLEGGYGIVTGAPTYAADIRRPGMAYGRVLYPPTLPLLPVSLIASDRAAAQRERGFVALVQDPLLRLGKNPGIGIIAETPGALDWIEAALAAEWSTPPPPPEAPGALTSMHSDKAETSYSVQAEGDAPQGPFDIDLTFDIPAAAHAPIEPRACVADYTEEGDLTLWAGHQDAFYIRDKMVGDLGLDADRVRVHAMRIGGGFGGKTLCTVEMEAAVLSRHLRRPVKVQWTRAQEMTQGHHRPPSGHHIRASVTDGGLRGWSHRFRSGHILFTNAALPHWMQRGTDLVVGDPGVARGSALPYLARDIRVDYGLARLPVFAGPWRGLGAGPNLLAQESAIDEAAHAAGVDPLAFRLANLPDGRLRAVLEQLRDLAGWTGPQARHEDGWRRARGVACGIYKDMSFAAAVADLRVAADGTAEVAAMFCTHDCGQVINPDQVRAQCEGNLIWGLGSVLIEGLHIDGPEITARDFADSPIPTMAQAPALTVALVASSAPPSGAGETAIVSSMGAVANALRAATGHRALRFPVDPAALAA